MSEKTTTQRTTIGSRIRGYWPGRSALVLLDIWTFGILALGAVVRDGDALDELRRHAGTQFDPAAVEAFAASVPSRLETTPVATMGARPRSLVGLSRIAA
jgi:hypothetical protein